MLTADRKAPPRTLLELDRFSSASLKAWKALSADLDQLEQTLYFALEPERRRLMPDILAALQNKAVKPFDLHHWVRIVSYSYSRQPLSAAGSLREYGGRFNVGLGLDGGVRRPWPCLYVAENFETAYRERFQLSRDDSLGGLTPEELALRPNSSMVSVQINGRLHNIFDMTKTQCFDDLAAVLSKIKMPERAVLLQRKLQIPATTLFMMRRGAQFWEAAVRMNWRLQPVQFGLPSQSQILGSLIRSAGYEGILYPSSKSKSLCLAVFPEQLQAGSFLALEDTPPHSDTLALLNIDSAEFLAGWESLPLRLRPG